MHQWTKVNFNARYILDAIITPTICKSWTSVFLNYATMIYYFSSVSYNYIALQTKTCMHRLKHGSNIFGRHCFSGAEDHCCWSDVQVTWFLNLILYLLYLFPLHLFAFTLCGCINLSASLKHQNVFMILRYFFGTEFKLNMCVRTDWWKPFYLQIFQCCCSLWSSRNDFCRVRFNTNKEKSLIYDTQFHLSDIKITNR